MKATLIFILSSALGFASLASCREQHKWTRGVDVVPRTPCGSLYPTHADCRAAGCPGSCIYMSMVGSPPMTAACGCGGDGEEKRRKPDHGKRGSDNDHSHDENENDKRDTSSSSESDQEKGQGKSTQKKDGGDSSSDEDEGKGKKKKGLSWKDFLPIP
ncbi:hypothetical protein F4810DRAFT_94912 [Camillea tinctor]|nr:hypothetical protein F4810DRAFT_94912 [Camillea tinctor]